MLFEKSQTHEEEERHYFLFFLFNTGREPFLSRVRVEENCHIFFKV